MNPIPQGYKQTEIGVIPEDWEVVTVGSLCVIFGRIGFRGYTKADIVDENQGVLSISPSNISNGSVNFDNGTYISWAKYHESPEIKIFNGDVLLVKTGSTYGKVGLVRYLEREATLNPQVVVLKNIKCPSSLLAYVMQFEFVQNQIEETIVGGAIPTLSQKAVANYLVPMPKKQEEQTAIATALSDVDALITGLESLIAKKQAIKTATMQQLLTGKTRLPQFAHHPDGTRKGTQQTELGEIPEDWDLIQFEKLCKIFTKQTGFDYSAYIKPSLIQEARNGFLPFIQNKDFEEKQINFETDYFVPESLALRFPNILLNEKSLLISISGKIGNVGVFDNHKLAFIGGAVAIAKFFEPELVDWVMYYLLSLAGQNTLLKNVKAGSHQNLILDDIRQIVIPMPSLNEQSAIAQILSDIDKEIQTLQTRLSKTQQIKQGMMQQLLTGKVRLVKPLHGESQHG